MRIPLSQTSPNLIAIAGPNGAGKSTFYSSYLAQIGLPFVNADVMALNLGLGVYEAADQAEVERRRLFAERSSFIFETVFSDPVGGKLAFLEEAVASGYHVVLCFVGISNPVVSEDRVAIRVSKGGHDVPTDKLVSRYPRVMENLRRAMGRLPLVLVYDNDDLREPHRFAWLRGWERCLRCRSRWRSGCEAYCRVSKRGSNPPCNDGAGYVRARIRSFRRAHRPSASGTSF